MMAMLEEDVSPDTADGFPKETSAMRTFEPRPSEVPSSAPSPVQASSISEDGSSSDVSMSADTDEEDNGNHSGGVPTSLRDLNERENGAFSSTSHPPKKRTHSDAARASPNGLRATEPDLEPYKRFKLEQTSQIPSSASALPKDRSLLPAEIWHCIFTFTPPRSLGSMLLVNKSFNAYLTPSSDKFSPALPKSSAPWLSPDAIWRASRGLYRSQIPSPLQGQSELDMWRLACGGSCQFCGKKRSSKAAPEPDKWRPGPGENGITSIWAFAVRACGPCVQEHTIKEIDLLLSSSMPSPLVTALPFVFFTNELHIIPPLTIQSGQQPSFIQIGKHFYRPHVEAIKAEFLKVKSLGSATAEEWLKGLDGRGKERKADAARWERWDMMGGVHRMKSDDLHELQQLPMSSKVTASTSNGFPHFSEVLNADNSTRDKPNSLPKTHPQRAAQTFPIIAKQRFDSSAQNEFVFPNRGLSVSKHARTMEEVVELKASRKAEIERRAILLDQPIRPGVLAHMSSFQAAIQIIQPLSDQAWEILRPRLLSQRHDAEQKYDAEQRDNERIAQAWLEGRLDGRLLNDVQARAEPKDLMDRECDELQRPLRARIGGYADEIIHNSWDDGNKLTKETASKFAADVLIYVRERFYAEMAKDEAAGYPSGRQSSNLDLRPQKLVLENMKWVFDTKIKPHTEYYSKELFHCSACENHFKWYGFEGIIQHYAAKHTTSLSVGSVVVHWKSEWPEVPPFSTDISPDVGRNSYYITWPSTIAPLSAAASAPPSLQHTHAPAIYQPKSYQESPAPFYESSQCGDQYPLSQGYSHPQQAYVAVPQEHQQQYLGQQHPNGLQPPAPNPQYPIGSQPPPADGSYGPSQNYTQANHSGSYALPTQALFPSPYPGPACVAFVPRQGAQVPSYSPQTAPYTQAPTYTAPTYQYPQPAPRSEEYTTRLQDLAKNAREIWDTIGNAKDVPGSVKVYTIVNHVLRRSKVMFQDDLPLSMLQDALSNNKDMRPVRNINGLVCKACTMGMPGTPARPDKKHLSFPQLVNHFYSAHEQNVIRNNLGPVPDWTKDMVELPDHSRLSQVRYAPGMDEQKLRLFAEALPDMIAPKVEEPPRSAAQKFVQPHHSYATRPSSEGSHERYYAPVDSDRDGAQLYERTQDKTTLRTSSMYSSLRSDQESFGDRRDSYRSDSSRLISPLTTLSRPMGDVGRYIPRKDVLHPRYQEVSLLDARPQREEHCYADREPAPSDQTFYSKVQGTEATEVSSRPNEAQYRPAAEPARHTNSLFEIVAQISQQAQQARKQPIKGESFDSGSEDGELQHEKLPQMHVPHTKAASSTAERFLNNLSPNAEEPSAPQIAGRRTNSAGSIRLRRNTEHSNILRHAYQPSPEPHRRYYEIPEEESHVVDSTGRVSYLPGEHHGFICERASESQARPYAYEERYVSGSGSVPRDRSEMVDHRFEVNNVVYHDERPQSLRPTPARYARYESVRIENEHARSRSPVYVKVGTQPGQFQERNPSGQAMQTESVYRIAQPEEVDYERAPHRQEMYRVYADDSRIRQPRYAETYEYVQMSDERGEYIIRRPVRRDSESMHGTYEGYSRPSCFKSHRSVQRIEPGFEEEYDPRHPEPPTKAFTRQIRYQ